MSYVIRHVTLPLHEARCVPHSRYERASGCARFLMAFAIGRPLADYTHSMNAWSADKCGGFLPASEHRGQPADAPQAHESVRGLS